MGTVYAVYSMAGGVGKTLLAVNTSAAIAKETGGEVLLVDCSIPAKSDISAYFALAKKRSVSQLVPVIDTVDSKLLKEYPVFCRPGLRVLSLVLDKEFEDVEQENFQLKSITVLTRLLALFDFVVFDISLNYSGYLEKILELSERIIIPFEASTVSLIGASHCMDFLKQRNFPRKNLIPVLNKTRKKTVVSDELIAKRIGRPVRHKVPLDEQYDETFVGNKIYSIDLVDHPLSQSITRLVIDLLQSGTIRQAETGNNESAAAKAEEITPEEVNLIKSMIHEELLEILDLKQLDISEIDNDKEKLKELQQTVRKTTVEILDEKTSINSREIRNSIVREVLQEALGLGLLEDFLEDPSVSEIMVNRWDKIYFERGGKLNLSEKKFLSEKQLLAIIDRIVTPLGRRIDTSSPMVDARLKDGSRVNAVIPPLAVAGAALTIRKFASETVGLDDLISFGSLNSQLAEFLKAAVKCRMNIIVSGGTGSGKTTLLNILSSFIPDDERIITIEDSAELQLRQPNLITMESRPPNIEGTGEVTIRDLVRNALRMRPDRIVVGECRSGEALDMLQAMNTGHDGSLTTLHANSPKESLSRLETLVMFAGFELPAKAIREQIAGAINIIIQLSRLKDGSRKILKVAEVNGVTGESIQMEDIYVFKIDGQDDHGKIIGNFISTGYTPACLSVFEEYGISMAKEIFWKTA